MAADMNVGDRVEFGITYLGAGFVIESPGDFRRQGSIVEMVASTPPAAKVLDDHGDELYVSLAHLKRISRCVGVTDGTVTGMGTATYSDGAS